jgi:aspartate carbamoyltransferase catalytic subunit
MLKPIKLANNNFLSSLDLSNEEISNILEIAKNFKTKKLNIQLKDKVLGLIFNFLVLKFFAISKILDISSFDKSKLDRKLLLASLIGFNMNISSWI